MLKEIIIAISSYGKAHRFISKHKLWKWILLPGLIYCILFVAGIILFWQTANSAVAYISNVTGLRQWLETMNSGWLSFLVSFASVILTLVMLLFYFSLFKYLWLIIGSPIFAYLSEKTESLLSGKDFPFSFRQLLQDALRGIALALRNTLWQSVYFVAVLLLSLIPLIGWATPVLALFIECYYYGFSMLDYSCERNKLSTAESIRFIGAHRGLAIGNGLVFYLMHLVPIVGWIFSPAYAVVAATISLYHQQEEY